MKTSVVARTAMCDSHTSAQPIPTPDSQKRENHERFSRFFLFVWVICYFAIELNTTNLLTRLIFSYDTPANKYEYQTWCNAS